MLCGVERGYEDISYETGWRRTRVVWRRWWRAARAQGWRALARGWRWGQQQQQQRRDSEHSVDRQRSVRGDDSARPAASAPAPASCRVLTSGAPPSAVAAPIRLSAAPGSSATKRKRSVTKGTDGSYKEWWGKYMSPRLFNRCTWCT